MCVNYKLFTCIYYYIVFRAFKTNHISKKVFYNNFSVHQKLYTYIYKKKEKKSVMKKGCL
jgi:hypothetical protein